MRGVAGPGHHCQVPAHVSTVAFAATMREQPQQQPTLFTYGTGVSLRAPERRGTRLPLLVAVLLLTAAVAGLLLVGFVWLATADYAAMFSAAVDLVVSTVRRG